MPIRYHMNNFSVGANLVFTQGRGANLKFDRRIYVPARSHLCRAGTARHILRSRARGFIGRPAATCVGRALPAISLEVAPEDLSGGPQPPL